VQIASSRLILQSLADFDGDRVVYTTFYFKVDHVEWLGKVHNRHGGTSLLFSRLLCGVWVCTRICRLGKALTEQLSLTQCSRSLLRCI
jgi:hypothetical protein